MNSEFVDRLVMEQDTKIIFLLMDGLGGLPKPETGETELEAAHTPNLDALARGSLCGLLDPIGYGITPGSGPAHFALFGYDPEKNNVGRGLLAAAGIDFPMGEDDLFARVNFATINDHGMVTDRRAGRIDSDTNRRLCEKLHREINLSRNVDVFFETVKEHRALLTLRGKGLSDAIADTDPEATGKPPLPPQQLAGEAQETVRIIAELLDQAGRVLADEQQANTILLRGFARYRKYPSLRDRFKIDPLAIANYPMYRGIARLLGMEVHPLTDSTAAEFDALRDCFDSHTFFFLHVKPTDSRGEDGDFEAKVRVIEEVDSLLPRLTSLKPDVLVVTGDHSTPAIMASHSWHPVPVILASATARPDRVETFGERACIAGGMGRLPMKYLMGLALAHAGRLTKFGA